MHQVAVLWGRILRVAAEDMAHQHHFFDLPLPSCHDVNLEIVQLVCAVGIMWVCV
jgi:hypothetical protein